MTIEEQLKQEILLKYRSVRAFTSAVDIPYSTLNSAFKRGISNAGVVMMLKVFNALSLDIESIPTGTLFPKETAKQPGLTDIGQQYDDDAHKALSIYVQLDQDDRGEIRGEMKQMLKADKYKGKTADVI